jgi:hypothetical protein
MIAGMNNNGEWPGQGRIGNQQSRCSGNNCECLHESLSGLKHKVLLQVSVENIAVRTIGKCQPM